MTEELQIKPSTITVMLKKMEKEDIRDNLNNALDVDMMGGRIWEML